MTNIQKQIYDLIEQLETEHGIVPAFRVTKHLAEAFNELVKKPIAPKRGKDQLYRSGSITKMLAVVPIKQASEGTQEAPGSICGPRAEPDCHPQASESLQPTIRTNGVTDENGNTLGYLRGFE